MRRETAAGLLLAALLLGAMLELHMLDELGRDMLCSLDMSQAALSRGDGQEAAAALDDAIAQWDKAQKVLRLFLRQPQIDQVTEAVLELKGQLMLGETDLGPGYDLCRYELRSTIEMEHPSLGSIL